MGNPMDGAVGPMCPQKACQASAEIEDAEKDNLVTIDTPISPHRDLIALLKQTSALRTDSTNSLTLNSFFLFVEEEVSESNPRISEHVRELLQEYQKKDESEWGGQWTNARPTRNKSFILLSLQRSIKRQTVQMGRSLAASLTRNPMRRQLQHTVTCCSTRFL